MTDPASNSTDLSTPQSGGDVGMMIVSYMLSGLLIYGGLGWLGDRYLGTEFLLPIGFLVGMALSFYMIVKRYGSVK